ncbi:uncharacterized acetyltransferase YvcN-like [Patella vulgata]|uniref:uncharacterized acetyltransferase YvcN-like n=1 Tax=Patella vulgata TaxID=6465 RepID=UPI0024A80062|nr:uncharacterized acetyltransferase YvcN-like [Patella vulgata]
MELTKEESNGILKTVLHLDLPDEDILKPNLILLNKIIMAVHEHLPFQNLTLMAENVADRHRPTWCEIKSAMLKNHGGLCYPMNLFLYRLLEVIGYEVTMAHSTITQWTNINKNDHVVVFVHNVNNEGDLFLAEVGLGCPTFDAIDMSFDKESKIYEESTHVYKYTKSGGKGFRMYKDPEDASWKELYVFDLLGTKKMEQFEPYYDRIFTDPTVGIFHSIIRTAAFPNKKAVAISNDTKTVEDEEGNVEKSKLATDDDIIKEYEKLFPQFEESIVKSALANWRSLQKEKSK